MATMISAIYARRRKPSLPGAITDSLKPLRLRADSRRRSSRFLTSVLCYPQQLGKLYGSRIGEAGAAVYAMLSAPAMQRDGTLRALGGSAPRPVAPPSPTGSNDQRTLLIAG